MVYCFQQEEKLHILVSANLSEVTVSLHAYQDPPQSPVKSISPFTHPNPFFALNPPCQQNQNYSVSLSLSAMFFPYGR